MIRFFPLFCGLVTLASVPLGCGEGFSGDFGDDSSAPLRPSLRALRVLGCEQGLRIEFAVDMEASSVSTATFVVERAMGNVSYDSAGRSATYIPIDPFVSGESYTAILTESMRAVTGEYLPGPVRWQFTCVDRSPPVLLERTPLGSDQSPLVRPTLRFSEPLDEATLTPENIFIKGVESTLEWDVTLRTLTLVPVRMLHPGRTYEVTVLGKVRDLSGNALGTDVTWSFRTRPPRGDWSIRLVTPPLPRATECGASIDVLLSPAISVAVDGFVAPPLLVDGAPDARIEYVADEHLIRIEPALPLRPGVTLPIVATRHFVDAYGDALFDDQALVAEVTVVERCEIPTVVEVPALRAPVSCDDAVPLIFSHPMQVESLAGRLTLRDLEAGGWVSDRAPVIEAELRLDEEDVRIVYLEPSEPLSHGRSYWLALEPGVSSSDGETLAQPGGWEVLAACE